MDITYKDFPEEVLNEFDTENNSEKEIIDSIFGSYCLNSFSAGLERQGVEDGSEVDIEKLVNGEENL